ncbi:hypothetical protein ABLG96_05660 [Nakamurella sp. A5-74]|uniref:Uncharacterized protein n=1 Tax=Nakamurella sp. A5-74 TaxID=3158264 RepID=A0AAU8DS13_9ACTN
MLVDSRNPGRTPSVAAAPGNSDDDRSSAALLEAIPHPFDDEGPNPEVLGEAPVQQRG